MPIPPDRFPVIIGVGQAVDRWDGLDPAAAPNPVSMIRTAIERAVADTGTPQVAGAIDTAVFVRTFPDSLREPVIPFGRIENLPCAVLAGMDLAPDRAIYSAVGGEQPQALVNEFSAAIAAGECEMAIIAGGEVTGAMKAALRAGHMLDWANGTEGPVEDRGKGEALLSPYELRNGLGMPPQVYAAQEQAWRTRHGLTTAQWRANAGKLFSRFSSAASTNPFAQFPQELSAQFIAEPSPQNYPICDPLLKWHVAQDAVNQSAAVILTSAGKARALGVSAEKLVYLHGSGGAKDALISQRPDLSHSGAMRSALKSAIEATQFDGRQIAHRDLYSCFPIAVMLAAEYLGIDPLCEPVTVTGGLPFFGGPGNNYSTHAIAAMVETLRGDRGSFGLILANGGFLSKEAAGVYSAIQPENWQPSTVDETLQDRAAQNPLHLLNENCEALIEAFTVLHGRTGPTGAYVIAVNSDGRVIAQIDMNAEGSGSLFASEDWIGRRATVEHRDGRNFVVGVHRE